MLQEEQPIAPKESSSLVFVETVEDLRSTKSRRVVFVGDSTFVSMKDVSLRGYVTAKPRLSISKWRSLHDKNPPKVYFSVRDDMRRATQKQFHVAIVHDAYLQWGYGKKGSVILLGGICGPHQSKIQVFHFENGKLIDTEEQLIPGYETMHEYTENASVIIEDYLTKFPSAKVYYAAPLHRFNSESINAEYVDESIFKTLRYRPLEASEKVKKSSNFVPVTVCVLGAITYGGLFAKGWTEYQAASSEFDEAMSDPVVKEAGGIDPNLIDVIQQQRFVLSEAKTQVELSKKTRLLVNAVAKIGDVQIKTLSVILPVSKTPSASEKPDIKIVISVPIAKTEALEQAKGLLEIVSTNSGLTLHLARQGFRDIDRRREFTFEGYFNG